MFKEKKMLNTKNNIVILFPNYDSLIGKEMRKRNKNTYSIYKNHGIFLRIIRKIHFKFNLPYQSIWYGNWKNSITDNSTVILFDSIFSVDIVNWIKKSAKNVRIIFWFWNPVNIELYDRVKNLSCELWAFDRDDCNKYDMSYNTQFYFNSIKIPNNTLKYDVLFVGRDKGRYEYIKKLERIFSSKGMSTYFHIVVNKHNNKKKGMKLKPISYLSLLEYISKSKVLLDITQSGQVGLTLRTMESLFFEKKLITNNKSIVKEDFYHKENIFIIDYDNYERLLEFLNTPYVKVKDDIKNKYDFDNWINRFGI